ncbi:MAG: hypothetical protein ACR2MB_14785 [Acidimicrobiales bacterium]
MKRAATITVALIALIALIALAGCGGSGHAGDPATPAHVSSTATSPTRSQTAIPLGPTPTVVTNYLAGTARHLDFPAVVPERFPVLPASKTVGGRDRTPRKPNVYMGTFNNFAFNGGDGGHVLLGGQRAPFSLQGHAGQRWPRPGQPPPNRALSLPTRSRSVPIKGGGRFQQEKPARILRSATVHGTRALVLKAPPYPLGLIHGGHVIVIWNKASTATWSPFTSRARPRQAEARRSPTASTQH